MPISNILHINNFLYPYGRNDVIKEPRKQETELRCVVGNQANRLNRVWMGGTGGTTVTLRH
jgi:hypothetical protein